MLLVKMPAPNSIVIFGVPVHDVTIEQTVALANDYMSQKKCRQIATVNPEFVMAAQQDTDFLAVLREADLCLPDGVGLLYAARWLGAPLAERVPGSALVLRLAELAADQGRRLFLLGAAPGVAQEAAARLKEFSPGLIVAGTYAGSPDPEEDEEIVSMINESRADLLYVAYGAPRQDKWIARNKASLSTVRLAIGVGGSLDFVAGRAERAPVWVQDMGLEWLHRLVKEPWRWRRMLALPRFGAKVLLTPRVKS